MHNYYYNPIFQHARHIDRNTGTPVWDFQNVDAVVSMQVENADYQRIREIYMTPIYTSRYSGTGTPHCLSEI